MKFDDEAYTTSQIHCYPYQPGRCRRFLPERLLQRGRGREAVRLGAPDG